MSVDSSGVEGDWTSTNPAISADGRFVAFESGASNLVGGDTNNTFDVIMHDRDPDLNGVFDESNGVTTRVSVHSNGTEGNAPSFGAAISGDGAVVVFSSDARNLVNNDKNLRGDVFLHDRSSGLTSRLSVDTTGTIEGDHHSFNPQISADGAFVTFQSHATNLVSGDTNQRADVFLRDRVNQTTTLVSVDSSGVHGDLASAGPAPLSSDGAVIAFYSWSTNLVANDTNGRADVFLRDRVTGVTTRVSVDSAGLEADSESKLPALSADGTVVAYESLATNLVAGDTNADFDVFAHDVTTGATTPASFNCGGLAGNGRSFFAGLSADGSIVAYGSSASDLVAGDTNSAIDVFAFDPTVIEPAAGWNNYGAGFPGKLGIPTFAPSADPRLGASITLDVGNSAGVLTVGFMLIGAAEASIPTKDGGTLLVDFSLILPLVIGHGGLALPVDVPVDPALCGISAYLQVIKLDAGAQFGLSFTPGLELALGH